MTDEMNPNPPVEAGLEMFQDTMEEFLAAADVRVVYGEPIKHDDTIIIPIALPSERGVEAVAEGASFPGLWQWLSLRPRASGWNRWLTSRKSRWPV